MSPKRVRVTASRVSLLVLLNPGTQSPINVSSDVQWAPTLPPLTRNVSPVTPRVWVALVLLTKIALPVLLSTSSDLSKTLQLALLSQMWGHVSQNKMHPLQLESISFL